MSILVAVNAEVATTLMDYVTEDVFQDGRATIVKKVKLVFLKIILHINDLPYYPFMVLLNINHSLKSCMCSF